MQIQQMRCPVQFALRAALGFLLCATQLLTTPAVAQSGSRNPFGQGSGPLQSKPAPPPRMPVFGPQEEIPLLDVRVIGNSDVTESRIRNILKTRRGNNYDPEMVQGDVRTLMKSNLFSDVRTYKETKKDGVIVTYEVVERPLIQYVHFVGNEKVKDKALHKAVGLKVAGPLSRFSVEEGKRRLANLYQERGFNNAQVSIVEGAEPGDRGVAYQINEGTVVRIRRTSFVGNTIASSARLRTQIDSKPGILWLIGGKLNKDSVEQDEDRLTAYYRSLGFFKARVGRELEVNQKETWADVKFVIDEGPRYRIRNISFDGNENYTDAVLARRLQISPGEFYNVSKLQGDLRTLRDTYGSNGYITSDINAVPKFLEEPGVLDLVYEIDEGRQYRVGRILVNIDGDYAHTRRSVVLNRMSIRPGDIVDIRELRSSERRLQASQLFLHDPAQGITPKIVVKAPDPADQQMASSGQTQFRGQSPGAARHRAYRPAVVDVYVSAQAAPDGPPAGSDGPPAGPTESEHLQ